MADWKRQDRDELPLYQAGTMSWLPGVVQGFTTRTGGVSAAPYDSLNLGERAGDDPANVQTNRQRLWDALGVRESQVALAEQVHGSHVAAVTRGSAQPVSGADALITNTPDLLLVLLFADCVPIYMVDPVGRAIGLVHAGWRGTLANIVGQTAAAMQREFGTQPGACLAAIGPCIGGDNYEVRADVADPFRQLAGLRAATAITPRNEFGGTYNLNLRQIVYSQLLGAGFRADYIAVSSEDTFRSRRDFFSFRRDGARSGRMAAFLGLRAI